MGTISLPAAQAVVLALIVRGVRLLFTRGWVTFVQSFPIPEIASGELNEDFEFLKTLSIDYPPRSLPSLNEIGKVCPISRADLLGLDRYHGVHKVWRCLAPYYAVQIAPELGI